MGVRSKQLNLEELYSLLDPRYSGAGEYIDVTIGTNWNLDSGTGYYVQTINDAVLSKVTADCKMVVEVKHELNETDVEKELKDDLFFNIQKIEPSEASITVYSSAELATEFKIRILYFG